MRIIGFCFASTIMLVLIIPGLISFFFGVDGEHSFSAPIAGQIGENKEELPVLSQGMEDEAVFNVLNDELIDLEDYICGVVAAEMPAAYEPEALKAQAVAARTYAGRRLNGESAIKYADIKTIGQAYLSNSELKSIWGGDYEENYAKIKEAVNATQGQIMVYDNEPIEAVFHSSSAGMTQNAEDVWSKEYPYLKSVVSEEMEEVSEKRIKNSDVLNMLSQSIEGIVLTSGGFTSQFQIISRNPAGYVLEAQVGNMVLTGRQIREVLGLKSSAFTVSEKGDEVIFTTKGYGHGVGMSQSGAQNMAKSGYGYKDILEHYYNGALLMETRR